MTNVIVEDKATHLVGEVIGKTVVNPVVECLDVDGVARRVDVNSIVERIDVNELMDRIDWNRVLDRIDLDRQMDRLDVNRHIQRIDMNAMIERIDMNQLVTRSDISSFVAHSTSGIFTRILDALRTQVVVLDYYLMRLPRILPPAPGVARQERVPYPEDRTNKAIAVQGRYTGTVSKGLSLFLDAVLITLSFAILLTMVEFCWNVLVGASNVFKPHAPSAIKVDRDHILVVAFYGIFWHSYFFLSVALAGQTVGMVIIGIKLVNAANGLEVSVKEAVLRTLIMPITTIAMPFLCVIGIFRRDGRMLHDLIAGTGVVYHSNARMAKLRERAMAQIEQVPIPYSHHGINKHLHYTGGNKQL